MKNYLKAFSKMSQLALEEIGQIGPVGSEPINDNFRSGKTGLL